MKQIKKRFGIVRWVMFSLALITNSFLIAYSCLDEKTTNEWNRVFTNIFGKIINTFTPSETKETIELKNIELSYSNQTGYKWNYLDGYALEEIPLGSAKQIECAYTPVDATDKSIQLVANPSDFISVTQSGSKITVIGMKTGNGTLTATNTKTNLSSTLNISIVDPIAPLDFDATLSKTSIAMDETATIDITVNGGVLGTDELINFRYYDNRKLTFESSDTSVAEVNEYGVINPVSPGNAVIQVYNDSINKSFPVTITTGPAPSSITDFGVKGSNICFADDMILDQTSGKNHFQLTPTSGDTELNPEDFIWESSDELLARVDKHGVLRGFRKVGGDAKSCVIRCISKATKQYVDFPITVRSQLPTKFDYYYKINGESFWNKENISVSKNDQITIYFNYTPRTSIKGLTLDVASDNVEVTQQGDAIIIKGLQEGDCLIKVSSSYNKELVVQFELTVLKEGAINTDNIKDVTNTLRKTVGHAGIFMIAQIFTYLTFYMFFFRKKWWFVPVLSLGEGLFISGLSELIQSFVPSRGASIIDVLINFAGVVVGALLTWLVIFLVKKIKEKKANKTPKPE